MRSEEVANNDYTPLDINPSDQSEWRKILTFAANNACWTVDIGMGQQLIRFFAEVYIKSSDYTEQQFELLLL